MAKTVTITNGTGTSELINGTYSVSASASGYDNTSINPNTLTVVEGTNTYQFSISADGTLTIHITEDGTSGGTPIVGATLIRTDSSGNEYGNEITTDAQGNAVFANVPYAVSGAPTIYFKQSESDGNHEFNSNVQNITMTSSTQTLEIANAPGAARTITLTDENYTNLPIDSATLTLTN